MPLVARYISFGIAAVKAAPVGKRLFSRYSSLTLSNSIAVMSEGDNKELVIGCKREV